MGKIFSLVLFYLLTVSSSYTYAEQYIVKVKEGVIVDGSRYKKIAENTYLVEGSVEKSNDIEYVEPNYTWSIKGEPTDPMFGQLWGMSSNGLNAVNAWDITKGSKKVKVMVIDTGIDYNHPDLKSNVWTNTAELHGKEGVDDDNNGCIDDIHGCDFANNDGDPMDDNSHGTHCSGTIGASHNKIGVAGVMSRVTLVGCKFLTATGSGSTDAAIKCIDYGIKIGVDIMSNSWGGSGSSIALREAVERARDANILFVAAAGNSGTNNDVSPNYPSNYDVENVISVASHDSSINMSNFSCYGKNTVHVAAPGSDILSTIPGGGYKTYSGTSMATPHVSGALGLLLSYQSFTSFQDIKDRLLMTSVPTKTFRNKLMTDGRLDAYNLLTDTRPERVVPDDSAWITVDMDNPWESKHPYDNSQQLTGKIEVPGARYIRLIVDKMDTENNYDIITLKDSKGEIYDTISGVKSNFKTGYVEGDTIVFSFTSDASVTKWGFYIVKYQYQ